ncbi:helix-turn-helix transcriptional regulator [Peribacillus frigoritolerans]|nr:helix-turn-helix transcriptional regulator [Peribacillus frigoritolerans]
MEIKEFGQFIKRLRIDKSLSTHRLAELSGVSQSYISHLESGRKKNAPSAEIIKKLSENLDVSYIELMVAAGYYGEDELLEPVEETVKGSIWMKPGAGKTGMTMIDLASILEQKNLIYKNLVLTQNDRKRILDMLDIMFQPKEGK